MTPSTAANLQQDGRKTRDSRCCNAKSRPGYKYIRLIHTLSFALLCSFHADVVSGRSLTLKSAFSIKIYFFLIQRVRSRQTFIKEQIIPLIMWSQIKTPASLKIWFDPIMRALASNLWLCALPVFHFVRYRLFPPLPPISLCDLYVSKMIYPIFRNNVPSNH